MGTLQSCENIGIATYTTIFSLTNNSSIIRQKSESQPVVTRKKKQACPFAFLPTNFHFTCCGKHHYLGSLIQFVGKIFRKTNIHDFPFFYLGFSQRFTFHNITDVGWGRHITLLITYFQSNLLTNIDTLIGNGGNGTGYNLYSIRAKNLNQKAKRPSRLSYY